MRKHGAKYLSIGILAATLLMCAAYYVGFARGHGELQALKNDYEKQLGAMQQKAVVCESRNSLSLARLALYRTVLDLEQKNFGLANSHIRQAASSLSQMSPALVGTDSAKLEAIRRSVAAMNFEPAASVDDQRSSILNAAMQLETIVTLPPKSTS
jgi:hypothetical protein